ncbi:MAG: M48 family metalloprotease, partial [Planctomycetota bacterium]
AKIFPLIILPIFYPAKPLDRPALADRLKQLAGNTGMTITGIFNLALSKDTKKANAMLAGLGSSRRVYLSDTLLEAFNDDEITVVFAHELGHHIRKHIFKGIAMAAVVSSLLVSLLYWRLNPYEGSTAQWSEAVATFAQIMLIMTVFPLLTGPITNAIARHFERQADADAITLTDDPNAFRSTFQLLTKMNLVDPSPPLWEVIMFDDHPPMSKRIAMADQYEPQT